VLFQFQCLDILLSHDPVVMLDGLIWYEIGQVLLDSNDPPCIRVVSLSAHPPFS